MKETNAMNDENSAQTIQYDRIADAINYIHQNFREQPSLEQIATAVHVSPIHFQKQFKQWVGVSPKKFLQYISVEHAKSVLHQHSLTGAVYDTGLSSPSRLHDLFIQIEGMTPAEYKNQGQNLVIHYQFSATPFGEIIIASTHKGVCWMAFESDQNFALLELQQAFPKATFIAQSDQFQQDALGIFSKDQSLAQIKLHLKGTAFQLKVWASLLKIPMGQLSTYGNIAQQIQQPTASRAVGTAIGRNPIAFLIPCHRVIRATGIMGEYRWGTSRKTAIIGWEGVKTHESIT